MIDDQQITPELMSRVMNLKHEAGLILMVAAWGLLLFGNVFSMVFGSSVKFSGSGIIVGIIYLLALLCANSAFILLFRRVIVERSLRGKIKYAVMLPFAVLALLLALPLAGTLIGLVVIKTGLLSH